MQIEIDLAPDDADKRDYNVVFSKAKKKLNFNPVVSIADGVSEIYTALKAGKVDTSVRTVTVKWYKDLIAAKQLISSIELNGRLI
jgi:hypothetical protein